MKLTNIRDKQHPETLQPQPSWKPRMLRPLGISFLLFCLLATVGLLEVAARMLPHQTGSLVDTLANQSETILKQDQFSRRQTHGGSLRTAEHPASNVENRQITSLLLPLAPSTLPNLLNLRLLSSLPLDNGVPAPGSYYPGGGSFTQTQLIGGGLGAAVDIGGLGVAIISEINVSGENSGLIDGLPSPSSPASEIRSPIPAGPTSNPGPVFAAPSASQESPAAIASRPLDPTSLAASYLAAPSAITFSQGNQNFIASQSEASDNSLGNGSTAALEDATQVHPGNSNSGSTSASNPQSQGLPEYLSDRPPLPAAVTYLSDGSVVTVGDTTPTLTDNGSSENTPNAILSPAQSIDDLGTGPTMTAGDSTVTRASNGPSNSITNSPPTSTGGLDTPVPITTNGVEVVTESLTFSVIDNHHNPWFNPGILPPHTGPGPLIVYVYTVWFPTWAGFLGSGAFAVIILTMLQGVWSMFYNQMTLVEPFANMASPEGALAVDALFVSSRQSLLVKPWSALQSKRWIYLSATIASLLSTLFKSLGSEVLRTDTRSCDRSPPGLDPNGPNPCPAQLVVGIAALRALQGIIASVAVIVLILGLLLQLRRKTNGVYGDPSTLARVASLIHHPDTVQILRSVPPTATSRETKDMLKAHRFRLASYQCTDGRFKYGIIPRTPVPHDTTASSSAEIHGRTWHLWIHDAILALILLGLLAILVSYYKISDQSNKFNIFFNSQSFGARFILTGSGTVIASLWYNVYTEVEMLSRFTQLGGSRNTGAKNTVLAKIHTLSFFSIVQSLLQGRYFTSLITFTNILTFILIVALPGIPFRSGQARIEYIICNFTAMAIISILLLLLAAVAIWRSHLPTWPRKPDCLASIMTYLVDSELREYLDGEVEQFNNNVISTIKNTKWSFDKRPGADGVVRWTVAEARDKPVDNSLERTSTCQLVRHAHTLDHWTLPEDDSFFEADTSSANLLPR